MEREREEKDFGFLGKDDVIMPDFGFPGIGSFGGGGFNKIFSSLIGQLDKQFKELDREMGKETKREERMPASGISISIATGTGMKPQIKIKEFGKDGRERILQEREQRKPAKIKNHITEEKAREIAKLPREEAETKVRRMNDRVVYEIGMPGVSGLKDVIINQLENSIEIKAFSKDKMYVKLLPVKLPILRYGLKDETLILELGGR